MSKDTVQPPEALEAHLLAQGDRERKLFWHRLRWRAVARALPGQGAFDLLDVGAGAGFAGDYLSEQFPQARYFFSEPLASLEERLEQRFGHGRNMKAAATFVAMRFVLLLDVLEHQEDDRSFLRALVEKMQPGAQLILTVPALPILWSPWDAMAGHFRRYDRGTLRRAVADCPVVIREMNYLFPELLPAGLLRRFLLRDSAGGANAEFPALPRPLNELLYWVGRCTQPARGILPFGTSIFMRIEKC